MNIIEKYKLRKYSKTPIKIVINSEFDYKDHDINVLKECLNLWAKDEPNCNSNFRFEWIYTNPEQKEKVFFLSTSIGELKQHKLEKLIYNEEIVSNSYMTSIQNKIYFIEPHVKNNLIEKDD